jgi:hypothetical protein
VERELVHDRPRPAARAVGGAEVVDEATALSASYESASVCSYAAAATPRPLRENCGRQKRGWFGSLPMTNCFTWGYVRARSAV